MVLLSASYATNFSDSFGTVQSSGCAAQWYSTCEQDWDSAGDDDILALCSVSSNYGVSFKPDDSTATSIKKVLSITSGTELVEWRAKLHVFSDDSRVRLRLVFKNALGQTLASVSETAQYDVGVHDPMLTHSVPSGATSVEAGIAGLDAGTEFVVDFAEYLEVEATDAECDARAEAWRLGRYAACTAAGGTPTGTCDGEPDSSQVGGCLITCLTNCLHQDTDPAEFICPTGF
jgi:hypothetical protein